MIQVTRLPIETDNGFCSGWIDECIRRIAQSHVESFVRARMCIAENRYRDGQIGHTGVESQKAIGGNVKSVPARAVPSPVA